VLRIEVVRCGFGPCGILGVSPLEITWNSSRFMNSVAKALFGFAVLIGLSTTGHAQTYYYYPTAAPAAETVTSAANAAPTSYVQPAANQVVWYTYTPQSYQTTYTPQTTQTSYPVQYYQPAYQPQAVQPTVDAQVAPAAYATYGAAPAAGSEGGDPYGFLGWLNSTRASYGLPAVGYDANLSNWAAMNNDQQAARGMGHFVMGPARRQNAAMGAFGNIGSMWMNSPAHRAALLDPTIRAIGIAGLGAYWTFNAY
jgi:uncharacterized protein YkwD